MDEKWTASHEMAERIETLKARIAGYDRQRLNDAKEALAAAQANLATDERLLAEWQDIANRSA